MPWSVTGWRRRLPHRCRNASRSRTDVHERFVSNWSGIRLRDAALASNERWRYCMENAVLYGAMPWTKTRLRDSILCTDSVSTGSAMPNKSMTTCATEHRFRGCSMRCSVAMLILLQTKRKITEKSPGLHQRKIGGFVSIMVTVPRRNRLLKHPRVKPPAAG